MEPRPLTSQRAGAPPPGGARNRELMRKPRKRPERIEEPAKRKSGRAWMPEKMLLLAAIPVALLAVYLVFIAPDSIPLPRGVKVPFPALTRLLQRLSTWCASNPGYTALIALGLLVPGVVVRSFSKRYYTLLTVVASLALIVSYISIAAPIDRLLNAVERTLTEEQRTVPDYLPRER